mgnify:CR=1 FL=1
MSLPEAKTWNKNPDAFAGGFLDLSAKLLDGSGRSSRIIRAKSLSEHPQLALKFGGKLRGMSATSFVGRRGAR